MVGGSGKGEVDVPTYRRIGREVECVHGTPGGERDVVSFEVESGWEPVLVTKGTRTLNLCRNVTGSSVLL